MYIYIYIYKTKGTSNKFRTIVPTYIFYMFPGTPVFVWLK